MFTNWFHKRGPAQTIKKGKNVDIKYDGASVWSEVTNEDGFKKELQDAADEITKMHNMYQTTETTLTLTGEKLRILEKQLLEIDCHLGEAIELQNEEIVGLLLKEKSRIIDLVVNLKEEGSGE